MVDAAPAVLASNDPDEARRQQQCAAKYIAEINASEKAQRHWLERSRKIVRRYKKDGSELARARRFSILWANTQTIQPAVYSRPPVPVVARRFQDADPTGRAASEVLERTLIYSIDKQDMDGVLKLCSLDYVLLARGQMWERYEPTFGPEVTPEIELQVKTGTDTELDAEAQAFAQAGDPEYVDDEGTSYDADDVLTRDDGTFYAKGTPYRPVTYEQSVSDYVNWEDFGHSVARTWDEVTIVWRRVYLSRKQLIERFGEKLGKMVPLDWGPIEQGGRDDASRMLKKAAVYELWDKGTQKAYWISKSWSSRPLDEKDDPLNLDGFFPCPRPLLGTTANDSVIPIPDYVYYQDQAEEIDALTQRIASLEKALKLRGFYAGDIKTNLNNLLNSDSNTLIPVPDWQTLKDGGGVAGKIEWLPITQVVQTLKACIELRAQLIEDVYQITGVADIMRGMNDPRATAAAEKIKTAWGTLRVRDRQVEMMRFARDQLRIKADVIAQRFDPETLKAMTGVKLPTAEEKAQAQAMYQQGAQQYQLAVQQAQAAQQPVPPQPQVPPELQEVLDSPTWEDVIGLLRDNAARSFHIDIETDSTIEPNEADQKAQAVEFIGAMGQMISQWGPAIEAQPLLAPMAGALIKWGARRFRAGRELEDTIDQTVDQIVEAAKNAPPPGQAAPDKTPIEVQQLKNAQEQTKQDAENQRAQLQAQVDQGAQSIQAQANQIKQGDQQLKLVAINRDPNPQGAA